jgi:hypothetical protein
MSRIGLCSAVFVIVGALCASCNLPGSTPGPFPASPGAALPGASPEAATPRVGLTATVPGPGGSPPTSAIQPTPSPACTNRAAFVDDLTIRDNAVVPAGAAFTKAWRLRNDGTCAWTSAYQLVFVGGDGLGGKPAVPLRLAVMPGEPLDLEVDLTAPDLPGTYQGFWKLRGPSGEYFGVGANSDLAFWVRIVVPPASTATVISEPAIQATGSVLLQAGASLDLDQGTVDPLTGADISFDTDGSPRSLRPEAGVQLGLYASPSPPDPADCQGTHLSANSIPFLGPAAGTFICYTTTAGRLGYMVITALDGSLGLTFTTWAR